MMSKLPHYHWQDVAQLEVRRRGLGRARRVVQASGPAVVTMATAVIAIGPGGSGLGGEVQELGEEYHRVLWNFGFF